jgi:aryl-alcohol dehydrogenase-like predicted oxidoreductase
MHLRPLGPGAPAVTAVSFGAMPLSIAGRPDEAQSLAVLYAVFDAGITLVDTADVYCLDDTDLGHNERLLAKALDSWSGPREQVIVATKGGLRRPQGAWETDGHPASLRRACERSLTALRTDRIDLYQLHSPDPMVPFDDTIGALAELQGEGKIRWIGLSNVTVRQIETARKQIEVVAVQNRLNPFFREALGTGVVDHCRELGIGFLAYSPVGGGRLNRKLPAIPALQPIALAHGVSPHAVVLAWVLAQAPNVIVIPGARTVAHARDSITAGGVTLTPDEIATIDATEFSRA